MTYTYTIIQYKNKPYSDNNNLIRVFGLVDSVVLKSSDVCPSQTSVTYSTLVGRQAVSQRLVFVQSKTFAVMLTSS